MAIIDQPSIEHGNPGEPGGGSGNPSKDPRLGDLPHKEVDDPRKKPPASDPEIRKGPLGEPPAKAPLEIDPPPAHVPGDPLPRVEDPPAPGAPPNDVPMQV